MAEMLDIKKEENFEPELDFGDTALEKTTLQYHPRYTLLSLPSYKPCTSSFLTLVSADGITFLVHPLIIRMSSGVFDNMLDAATDNGDVIHLDDEADIIAALLDFIYPDRCVGLHQIPTVEFGSRLLRAAEKYDIPKIIHIIRDAITSHPIFLRDPISSYGIACQYAWIPEANSLSTASLVIDLNSSLALKGLENLNTRDLLKLQLLHSTRRTMLANSIICVTVAKVDSSTERLFGIRVLSPWSEKHEKSLLALKYLVMFEMERCAAGDTLQARFWARLDVAKLFCDDPWRKDHIAFEVCRIMSLLPLTIKDLDYLVS